LVRELWEIKKEFSVNEIPWGGVKWIWLRLSKKNTKERA
jgi:hypothetical protein